MFLSNCDKFLAYSERMTRYTFCKIYYRQYKQNILSHAAIEEKILILIVTAKHYIQCLKTLHCCLKHILASLQLYAIMSKSIAKIKSLKQLIRISKVANFCFAISALQTRMWLLLSLLLKKRKRENTTE